MPLRSNIPNPQREDWKLTTVPDLRLGVRETDLHRETLKAEPDLRAACTMCALKAGLSRKEAQP